ncbi:hypothetical protein CWO91_37625 [Bradyrhizobium genosp. SA-3]|nr:hypothetical protein [Bradyrhizobium genosp. SA-3]RZM97388.1 hypothetical protein CWO91_37625 [Bradyrhizobium genosp. SA-3]
MFDGPIVLAGGITYGGSLAVRLLGCELAYMGTCFIAMRESMATNAYSQMLVDSTLDDMLGTRCQHVSASLAAGLGWSKLDASVSEAQAKHNFCDKKADAGPQLLNRSLERC